EASFVARAQCVVDQFDSYQVLPGERVNGALTLGENIADLGGLTVAYHALADSGELGSEGDGFTPQQIFFLAYAQTRCESARPELISSRLLTDPHAPESTRVNGPLS